MVREPDATTHPTLQDHQLMSKHRVLGFKPQLRLWRGTGWPERNRAARSFRQFRRFHHVINSNKVFGTHRMTSHSKRCYADIVKCLARRWPRDAEFSNAQAISLTLTMGDDQFTIDLLDHLLKF